MNENANVTERRMQMWWRNNRVGEKDAVVGDVERRNNSFEAGCLSSETHKLSDLRHKQTRVVVLSAAVDEEDMLNLVKICLHVYQSVCLP